MWVKYSTILKVLKNPFDSTELIKASQASKLFKEIHEAYEKDFPTNIFGKTIPLNYFLEKYVAMTGIDYKSVEKDFLKYFEEEKKKRGESI